MNIDKILKIAKQLYNYLMRQKIKLPENILNQVLSFYNDFQNDGKKGQIVDFKNFIATKYVIKNIKHKLKGWYKKKQIKRFFGDELEIVFSDNCPIPSHMLENHSSILINVNYSNSDINNIKHELLHYFQHMLASEQELEKYYSQLYSNLKQFQKSSEYITYIENSCFYIFQLYMKTYNKDINFKDFYENKIQKKLNTTYFLDIEQLQTLRYNQPYNFVIQFLTIIYNRDKNEYNEIKQSIFEYSQQQSKNKNNLKEFINKKNYHQLAWLITNHGEEKEFVKDTLNLLIQNKQYKFLQYVLQHNIDLLNSQNSNLFNPKDIIVFVQNIKKNANKYKLLNFIKDNKKYLQYFQMVHASGTKNQIIEFIYNYLMDSQS